MNGLGCRSRDERTTAMIVNEGRRAGGLRGGGIVTSRWMPVDATSGLPRENRKERDE